MSRSEPYSRSDWRLIRAIVVIGFALPWIALGFWYLFLRGVR